MITLMFALAALTAPATLIEGAVFAKDATAFVDVDGANLRASPALDGALKAVPAFGDVVTVLEVQAPVQLGDLTDRWHRVRTAAGVEGWLFGNTLTSLADRANLDKDAALEAFTISFTPDKAPLVRIFRADKVVALSTLELPRAGAGARVTTFPVPPLVEENFGAHGFIGVRTCFSASAASASSASCDDAVVGMVGAHAIVALRAPSPASCAPVVVVDNISLTLNGHKKALTDIVFDSSDSSDSSEPPTNAQLVRFFERDCAGAVTVVDDFAGTMDACLARDFDQNCALDQFGCWEAGETCLDDCGKPCGRCQSACTSTCSSCKAKCAGDAACVRTCATSRARCHTTCLAKADTCRTSGCSQVESKCHAAAAARVAKECDDEKCEAFRTCASEQMSDMSGDISKCKTEGLSKWCRTTACYPDD